MDQTLKVLLAIVAIGTITMIMQIVDALVLKPGRLRSKLRQQGIRGPPSSIVLGNIREMRNSKIKKVAKAEDGQEGQQVISHNCASSIFPFFETWRKDYGETFMFALGNKQLLHMNDPDVVKEIITCTSLDFGKPLYQQKERGALLGRGILTSNGELWSHQRKMLAPELYSDKVKGMIGLMVESSIALVKSWNAEIEKEGSAAVVEVKVDEYMRTFSGDVISRACFGSNYSKGEEIFVMLRALQEAMSKKALSSAIPVLRSLPTASNREVWRLEKEVKELVLDVVRERKGSSSSNKDLLQVILEGASGDLSGQPADGFIVDNCKNIYLAGYETTAVASTWILMLLASDPEWQQRVRSEVADVCEGRLPDADSIRKMKTMTMVINESLRLYPPVSIVSREALRDMKFGGINVPKGVNVWTLMAALHVDPNNWGPDAYKFNPQRFANGVSGACKLPHLFMPFGVGPRTCLGQNFAMAELKILLAIIVSNFSFTLSPNYKHSPALRLVTEPEHGVDILITKL